MAEGLKFESTVIKVPKESFSWINELLFYIIAFLIILHHIMFCMIYKFAKTS